MELNTHLLDTIDKPLKDIYGKVDNGKYIETISNLQKEINKTNIKQKKLAKNLEKILHKEGNIHENETHKPSEININSTILSEKKSPETGNKKSIRTQWKNFFRGIKNRFFGNQKNNNLINNEGITQNNTPLKDNKAVPIHNTEQNNNQIKNKLTNVEGYKQYKDIFEEIVKKTIEGKPVKGEIYFKAVFRGFQNSTNSWKGQEMIELFTELFHNHGFKLELNSIDNYSVRVKGPAEYCKLTNMKNGASEKIIIGPYINPIDIGLD